MADVDAVFKALSDDTRRLLLDALRRKDGQTLGVLETAMASPVSMSRFGVMKHLKVLVAASLVVSRRSGRFKHHYLNAVPLQEVMDRWMEPMLVKPAARGMLDLKAQLEGHSVMPDTQSKPDFIMSTYINTTQDRLWHALTDAQAAGQWNFLASTCERDGNQLVYRTPDDSVMLICTETLLDPKTRIESTFEPKWAGPDVPLATSRFVYLIEPQGDFCKLTLEHYAIPAGQDGVIDGWHRTLSGLKTWLETGSVVKFAAPREA